MAHTQKPDFVFRRNGRVHLNLRGASVQSTIGSPSSCAHQPAGFVLLVQACVLQSCDAYWLPTPFSCFPLHFSSRTSPCAITFQTQTTSERRERISKPHLRSATRGLKKPHHFAVLFVKHLSCVLRNNACSLYAINCRILVRHTKQRATCLLLTKRLHVGWLEYA